MDKNSFKNSDLEQLIGEYFKGLTHGYSSNTLEAYERRLNELGITDFKQLKTDFKNGKYC